MQTILTRILIPLWLVGMACSAPSTAQKTASLQQELDTYLIDAMELHNIPGLALAVSRGDKVLYENYFGQASLEEDKAVNEQTLFRIFSATKLASATGVFQLIQAGKLDLEDSISSHLDFLPAHWHHIKIKHLLTHSSGLPDIIRYESSLSDEALWANLFEAEMEFEAGNQFRYNQTNYWLLALIIEAASGLTFEDFILENQFGKAAEGVLFSSNSQEVIPNRATRYVYNGKQEAFEKDTHNSGRRGHAGNGLNIRLRTFLEWNKRLDQYVLLEKEVRKLMWTPFDYANGKNNFLHGWGTYTVGGIKSYGFSGGNLAAFRKFEQEDLTIILLSNGYQLPGYDIIVNDIARKVIPGLATQNLSMEAEVMGEVMQAEYARASQVFQKLKQENPAGDFDNLKWNINSIGNALLYQDKAQEATSVYQFNADAHPEWWVAWASLAECYDAQADTQQAIMHYRKAMQLNSENEWGYNEQMEKSVSELEK